MGDANSAVDSDPALQVAQEHPQVERLSAFVCDHLMRQASGRALWAGERVVEERASKHNVSRDDADTKLGNVLSILGAGASSDAEWALLSALACRGLQAALSNDPEADELQRSAEALVWLEVNTPACLSRYLPALLDEPPLARLAETLCAQIKADDEGAVTVARRARNAARAALLQTWPAGQEALATLATGLSDPFMRGLLLGGVGQGEASPAAQESTSEPVAALSSDKASTPAALEPVDEGEGSEAPAEESRASTEPPEMASSGVSLSGLQGRPSAGPVGAVLRVCTGWALVEPVFRSLGFLIGLRRRVDLSLRADGLHVRRQASVLGVHFATRDQLILPAALQSHELSLRKPLFGYLIGVLGLCTAAAVGGAMAYDGLSLERRDLLLGVVAVVALGAGFDLIVAGLSNLGRPRVGLRLSAGGERIVLRGVDANRAGALREAMRGWAAPAQRRPSASASKPVLTPDDEEGAANVV